MWPSTNSLPATILSNAEYNLQHARFGLTDLEEEILPRGIAGIRNIATYGRATIKTLQRLISRAPEFDDWYQPYREEMKDDPLMRYFWELRIEVLKEGHQDIEWSLHIKELHFPEMSI